MTPDVSFPYLGIEIQQLNRVAVRIFGLEVYWYGVLIVIGIVLGVLAPWYNAKRDVLHAAKRPGEPFTPEQVLDFAYIVIPIALVGTRLYYVFSKWGDYKNDLLSIFAVREGGLAIYGAIITALATAVIYARVKKRSFLRMADVCVVGLPIGQAIGRWGNFMNQEVFGGYTDSLLAMRYKLSAVDHSHVTPDMILSPDMMAGVEYIQVHPTFLYESMWSLVTFALLMLYFNRRKFNGEILALYLFSYGFGRFWIEGIRTDQLMFFGTGIPNAQVVSVLLVLGAATFMIVRRVQLQMAKKNMAAAE